MAGSKLPFPWPTGQPRSLRAELYSMLILPATVGAGIGLGNDQVKALAQGKTATFATAQLQAMFPLGTEHPSLPADLGVADAWVLSGDDDDTLTPAA